MKMEDIDRLFHDSVNGLDGPPPQLRHWDADRAFHRIQENLQGNTKKSSGFFDLAAAMIALCIGTGYLFQQADRTPTVLRQQAATAQVAPQPATAQVQQAAMMPTLFADNQPLTTSEIAQEALAARPLRAVAVSAAKPAATTKPSESVYRSAAVAHAAKQWDIALNAPFGGVFQSKEKRKAGQAGLSGVAQKQLQMDVPIGVAFNNGQIAPVLGVQATFASASMQEKGLTVGAGVTSYHWMAKTETRGTKVESGVFGEVTFGKRNRKSRAKLTAHEIGVGYQLNHEDQGFGNRPIKVNYSITIKDQLKVAPEVMVDTQSAQTYAGVRVTII